MCLMIIKCIYPADLPSLKFQLTVQALLFERTCPTTNQMLCKSTYYIPQPKYYFLWIPHFCPHFFKQILFLVFRAQHYI